MVAIGFWFLLLTGRTLWAWRRNKLTMPAMPGTRRLLGAWVASAPLGYIAVECGWLVREIGRQPWIIYGLLRTQEAASTLPAAAVATTLAAYALVYTFLIAVFFILTRRLLGQGPDPGHNTVAKALPSGGAG